MDEQKATLAKVRESIESELSDFLGKQSAYLESISSDLAPVAHSLSSFLLDGGKRLRPLFAYSAFIGAGGVADKNVKDALKFQIQRVKLLEEKSRSGIEFLHPSSRPCIEAARILYCGIVDAVEAIDYEVFNKRAKVSMTQRLKVAIPAWREGVKARNEFGQGHVQGIAKVI